MKRTDKANEFGLSDLAALIMGSAIASVHILGIREWQISGPAWIMVAFTFIWVALTASGPFLFIARRYAQAARLSASGRSTLGHAGPALALDGPGAIGLARE